MKSYIEQLDRLGFPFPNELAIDVILGSLLKTFNEFVLNYTLNDHHKTVDELHAMLKGTELNIKNQQGSKTNQVLMIREGRVVKKNQKGKGKGKGKAPKKGKGKAKVVGKKFSKTATKPNQADMDCFHCGKKGHWKRNCPTYLEELRKSKVGNASTSGIFVIELYAFSTNSWVFDTGAGTHICNDLQGLKNVREIRAGDLELHVGNGAKVAVKAVGQYQLLLPSGLYLLLDNCCYVPSLTRNIISAYRLYEQGFQYKFDFDYGNISILKDNVFYCVTCPNNGIYEVDLTSSYDKQSSLFHVTKKKAKACFNKTYLWHCRLGHINKRRIAKLQSDGILESTGSESFDVCESCLCGKMTKAPFTGIDERAFDLLRLIHTDVCGPFRTMTRNSEKYFITFTDDFSRFGYVYLIKHKHEAFDVFKVFQNEIQNHLWKKIKAIRSDRGGEYLSCEFDDHLKNCGIVSQLTPPGTPQHNVYPKGEIGPY